MSAGSVGAGASVISRFSSVANDYVIDFGHHKDANHLVSPALKVSPIEVRDVRDRESGGRRLVVERHC